MSGKEAVERKSRQLYQKCKASLTTATPRATPTTKEER